MIVSPSVSLLIQPSIICSKISVATRIWQYSLECPKVFFLSFGSWNNPLHILSSSIGSASYQFFCPLRVLGPQILFSFRFGRFGHDIVICIFGCKGRSATVKEFTLHKKKFLARSHWQLKRTRIVPFWKDYQKYALNAPNHTARHG